MGIFRGILLSYGVLNAMAASAAEPVTITLLHTNDIHSHFRSENTPMQMGGLARLRTLIRNTRADHPDSLLVDGGDWSEGQIYYTEGSGAETLKLMDLMGYDAALVGNHDWLNGPDRLLDAVQSAHLHMAMLGANFEMHGYERTASFYKTIYPYVIKEVRGVKVAFIGLVNFDPIYQSFLSPVRSVDPGPVAENTAKHLKEQHLADIVVGISHNAIAVNQDVLKAAPAMDLIIGAHDHAKLLHPVVVARPGHPDAWIVEAGKWGQFLGQVELGFTPASDGAPSSLVLRDYRLHQVDLLTAEDGEVKALIDQLETRIESRMGPIFHDHVADCEDEITGEGMETLSGDWVTDAYKQATGADIALEQNKFIYDDLHLGAQNSADFFNIMSPIYNPGTGKAWTLNTWNMKGSVVSTLFRLLFTWRKITNAGSFSFSGMSVTYDPANQKDNLGAGDLFGSLFGVGASSSPVHSILVNGRPIDSKKMYKFVANTGMIQAIKVLNDKYFNLITLHDLTDTGKEDWRVVRDFSKANSPLTADKVGLGGRLQTWQADLGVVPGSLKWTPFSVHPDGSVVARVEFSITNYGANPSPQAGSYADLSSNDRGIDGTVDPVWSAKGNGQPVPSLQPGETIRLVWPEVTLPSAHGFHALLAYIHSEGETNTSNNGMFRYFTP